MTDFFEKGKIYTFYFGTVEGGRQVTGELISAELPLVKVETEGLIRIINCVSSHFVEAVTRREDEEISGPVPEV
jgi:hypothetical protein